MDSTYLITSFVTLFVVIDPLGLIPLFIALTQGMAPEHRRAVGLRACVIAAVLLTLLKRRTLSTSFLKLLAQTRLLLSRRCVPSPTSVWVRLRHSLTAHLQPFSKAPTRTLLRRQRLHLPRLAQPSSSSSLSYYTLQGVNSSELAPFRFNFSS